VTRISQKCLQHLPQKLTINWLIMTDKKKILINLSFVTLVLALVGCPDEVIGTVSIGNPLPSVVDFKK